MITNADLTIYNRILNKETKLDEYHRTVIRGIWWFVKNKRTLTDNGLLAADEYYVRIPYHADFGGKRFVPPKDWTGDPGTWTLQANDHIVKGECLIEIVKPSELAKEITDTFRILSWGNNDFGNSPHFRVQGV